MKWLRIRYITGFTADTPYGWDDAQLCQWSTFYDDMKYKHNRFHVGSQTDFDDFVRLVGHEMIWVRSDRGPPRFRYFMICYDMLINFPSFICLTNALFQTRGCRQQYVLFVSICICFWFFQFLWAGPLRGPFLGFGKPRDPRNAYTLSNSRFWEASWRHVNESSVKLWSELWSSCHFSWIKLCSGGLWP